jgi:predicted NAD/FAD-dependent oxidoreductase
MSRSTSSNQTQATRSASPSTAIVGAGLAGLTAARRLADAGHHVTVFDKGRGPGGRMSTRRHETWSFDHGAQYFTARDGRFRQAVQSWRDRGLVQPWNLRLVEIERGRIVEKTDQPERFVGVPTMSAICAGLAKELDVRVATTIARIERDSHSWRLSDGDGGHLGGFDAVIVTAPPSQSARLIGDSSPIAERIRPVPMVPCWSLMMGFRTSLRVDFDAAFINDAPIAWIARNTSKPDRVTSTGEAWIVHATPEWSADHLEDEPATVSHALLRHVADLIGGPMPAPTLRLAHRWRFARPRGTLGQPFLWDEERRIGACGDWCLGARVESAYLSGLTFGEHVAARGDRTDTEDDSSKAGP